MNFARTTIALLAIMLITTGMAAAQATDEPSSDPSWQPADPQEVRAEVLAWLDQRQPDEPTRAKAVEVWSTLPERPSGEQLLAATAETFALVDPEVAKLVRLCRTPRGPLALPSFPWLSDPQTPPLLAANMRLLYGRWLVQQSLFDEAGEQLADLKPADVVAPASLLFYQGVVHYSLLNKEPGLHAIDQLLQHSEQSPRRYVAVARLIRQDLEGLEDDTLGHIVRRMDDIRRRLDLGRAGKKVRTVEDGVIESLDKLIKKMEEQQRQSQSAGGANNLRSSKPAQDSRIMGGRGPGKVTRRDVGSESGWGDLPPKEREEALQQIGREFPSHYRDVIEQYFRRLASENND